METRNGERTNPKHNGLDAVHALLSAVETKESSKEGHSRKVGTYAVALAEAIGLSSDQVGIVGVAALLHDIGKMGIPDGVLLKKEKLSDEDWRAIKTHPRLGANIIKSTGEGKPSDEDSKAFQTASQSLWASMLRNAEAGRVNVADCGDIVLYHHERWDGTGYPEGLKGDKIPLGARIIAIANTFDVMTSDQPYRPAFSIEDTAKELRKCAGTQFDPKLVDAFIRIVQDGLPGKG